MIEAIDPDLFVRVWWLVDGLVSREHRLRLLRLMLHLARQPQSS